MRVRFPSSIKWESKLNYKNEKSISRNFRESEKEGIFPTDNEIKKAIETLKLISITPKELKRNLKLIPTPLGMS